MEMDLRIRSPQSRNIRLEARFIEPAKHPIEFVAQHNPDERQREFLKFYGFSEDTAEDLGGLDIRQFASRYLELFADKLARPLERQRYKSPNIIGRDGLVRFVASDRVCKLPL